MVDRSKVEALDSYDEILSTGFADESGTVQKKKGAFRFRKAPVKYGSFRGYDKKEYDLHDYYRTYTITSAGAVRATKGAFSKTIGPVVNLNSLNSYDEGLKAILVDIEKFEKTMTKRKELAGTKEEYLDSILSKSLQTKKNIIRVFYLKWAFEEIPGSYYGKDKDWRLEYLPQEIESWNKSLSSKEEVDRKISKFLGLSTGTYQSGIDKKNKRIIDRLLSKGIV